MHRKESWLFDVVGLRWHAEGEDFGEFGDSGSPGRQARLPGAVFGPQVLRHRVVDFFTTAHYQDPHTSVGAYWVNLRLANLGFPWILDFRPKIHGVFW